MKLFIFIACTCIYSVSTQTVGFIQQPMTDKECYKKGENGTLTLSFNVTGTTRLDNYTVALAVLKQDGTWVFKSNGTELNFYDTSDRDTKHARFRVTMSYISRTVEYRMDVTSLEYHDETDPLNASIIESHSGKVMIVSPVGARFYVNEICPQRLQPTTGDSNQDHTSDPNEPSTTTAPPNNDSTSTEYIPAKCITEIPSQIPIYIVTVTCFCILAICCIILHLLHNSPRVLIEPQGMGKRNRSKKTYFT